MRAAPSAETVECLDPRNRLCATDARPWCDAYLLKRLTLRPEALYDFVPRPLPSALGIEEEDLSAGQLEGTLDSLLGTALGPAGGDGLFVFDMHPHLGVRTGEFPGRLGGGFLDAGVLSFAGFREDGICQPMDVA